MNKYNVHIYSVFRIKVCNVLATSQEEAINRVQRQVDHAWFNQDGENWEAPIGDNWAFEHFEYAEEDVGWLVDEVGDEHFNNSHFYDPGDTGPVRATPKPYDKQHPEKEENPICRRIWEES